MTSKIRLASYYKSLVSLVIFFNVVSSSSNPDSNRQLYVVYMGARRPEGDYSPGAHHESILQSIINDSSVERQAIQISYGRSFDGFAAWLTDEERENLRNMGEVLSIFPSEDLELHTTRSWDFLGLSENVTQDFANATSDMIIGVMDSGIWTGSKSFTDEGFGPVPAKWKGSCKAGLNFTCNRKIIGARFYSRSTNISDDLGHGTHTTSTAAGNIVKGASFHGIAEGTARGGVPASRLAIYKVCQQGCSTADILASFDDAIADGVDVITASLGSTDLRDITEDAISIGSFHVMAHGIVTVNSAGNGGSRPGGTITELAPWVITVGASTTDRVFVDKLILGNGKNFTAQIINSFSMNPNSTVTLVYGSKNTTVCGMPRPKNQCVPSCLDENYVKGNIVVCDTLFALYELSQKGAAGVITKADLSALKSPLPAIGLTPEEFNQVRSYINSTSRPTATIMKSESAKDPLPPHIAQFSSRGPNRLFTDIMKPDVVAPGVNILAAYPPYITIIEGDKRPAEYNLLSGTSMACPHAAGAIAYIKSQHPNWSPSALKSALMTTARQLDASLHSDQEFAYGSGLLDPVKAADPGLVYDISVNDYINIICSVYNPETCHKISGKPCQCPGNKVPLVDLNYPSMTAKVNASSTINVTFTRVVTNVGPKPSATYNAQVMAAKNLTITVVPNTLSFKDLNEKKSFAVSVTGEYPKYISMLSSSLVWSDGSHTVRSPIILYA